MCLPGIKKVNRHSMTKKPMPDKYKIVTIDIPRENMTAAGTAHTGRYITATTDYPSPCAPTSRKASRDSSPASNPRTPLRLPRMTYKAPDHAGPWLGTTSPNPGLRTASLTVLIAQDKALPGVLQQARANATYLEHASD